MPEQQELFQSGETSWFGETKVVTEFLWSTADRCEEKNEPIIWGTEHLTFGLGNLEVIIPDSVTYERDGQVRHLARDLKRERTGGVTVKLF